MRLSKLDRQQTSYIFYRKPKACLIRFESHRNQQVLIRDTTTDEAQAHAGDLVQNLAAKNLFLLKLFKMSETMGITSTTEVRAGKNQAAMTSCWLHNFIFIKICVINESTTSASKKLKSKFLSSIDLIFFSTDNHNYKIFNNHSNTKK